MALVRILAGVISIALAFLFGAAAASGFWDEFVVHPKTSALDYDFMEVGGFTLVGWQIIGFYSVLALLALNFGLFAVYVLFTKKEG